MRIPIVILNYQGEKLLRDCLDSLHAQTYPEVDVWVADNASADGSLDLLRKSYPGVRLLVFERNFGFAKGYNLALREVFKDPKVRYFATLNNDTKVTPGWLSSLVEVMESHPDAATVTSKVLFYYEPDKIDTTGVLLYRDGSSQGRGHCETDRGQYGEVEEVFGASLVAALVRREAWEEAGGFEDIFFAYNEEVDVNWRMRLRGWKSYYCPGAVVYHVHSASFGSYSPTKVYLTERNRIWHIVRNLPLRMLLASPYYTAVRYWRLATGMSERRGAASKAAERTSVRRLVVTVLRAWLAGLALSPLFFVKRFRNQRQRRVSTREVLEWHRRFALDVDTLTLVNRERIDHRKM